jgi:hypothetical protein
MAGAKAPFCNLLRGPKGPLFHRCASHQYASHHCASHKNIAGEAQGPGDFLRAAIRKIIWQKERRPLRAAFLHSTIFLFILSFHFH